MTDALVRLLIKLAPRERRWLALLAFVVLPLGVVFGVLVPVHQYHEKALAERVDAIALNIWVQDRVREMSQIATVPDTAQRQALGTSRLEGALVRAGLREDVTALVADSDGTVELRFDEARFTRLMTWLSEMVPTWGYDMAQLRMERTQVPADVAASFLLRPHGAQN